MKSASAMATAETDPSASFIETKKVYQQTLSKLVAQQGFFASKVTKDNRIDTKNIDSAEAKRGETDEAFATRFQEAEFRLAGYYS